MTALSPSAVPSCALVWFRDDLRTDDHPALTEACRRAQQSGGNVRALYVYDPALWGRPLGGASQWWLHHSLVALRADLARLGIPLEVVEGSFAQQLTQATQRHHAHEVLCNRGQTPFLRTCEAEAKAALAAVGVALLAGGGELLVDPSKILTGSGLPYRVFTPFWKALSQHHAPQAPLPEPAPLAAPLAADDLRDIEALALLPITPDWAGGLRDAWTPGQSGAQDALSSFLAASLIGYASRRDFPAQPGTSRLSPHLRFGEISPRRIWEATLSLHGGDGLPFLREVGWREFNHHLLFQWPTMATTPLKGEFERFPWRDDPQQFQAWCKGNTGYPIVDAGQRELWETGWMHNRVRMISASFLVKDLLLPWQWGEAWMWDTLVDACPANNPGNWQWVSGCGADAAPYFRVFNPSLQASKFDPQGAYLRRWAPRRPVLPIVDHGQARDRALAALATLKSDSPAV